MKLESVEIMGMPLLKYTHKSCTAFVAVTKTWATLYSIESLNPGHGHATQLLTKLKKIYSDRRFGGSIALNNAMRRLYEKLNITEYK